jgi:hypothetical protein
MTFQNGRSHSGNEFQIYVRHLDELKDKFRKLVRGDGREGTVEPCKHRGAASREMRTGTNDQCC